MVVRHWVQNGTSGTGNWNATTHWDEHSGGAGGDSIPTSADSVEFDANSFGAAGQVVTVDAAASCLDLDWTGATNTPTLNVANELNIYGNITFIAAMNYTSASGLAFKGAIQTLTTNGLILANSYLFIANTNKLTFVDNVNLGTGILYLQSVILDTNGKTVTCGAMGTWAAASKTLTLGSSTINCTSWDMVTGGGAVTLTVNTSTINCSGNFAGGGLITYNIVNLTGATSTVSGSNTFATLGFTKSGVQTISLTDGTTQTVTALARDVGTSVKTLQGTSTAGWAIAAAGAATNISYVSLAYSAASPANKFYYGIGSTVGIGNSGWQPYQSNQFGIAGFTYMGDVA